VSLLWTRWALLILLLSPGMWSPWFPARPNLCCGIELAVWLAILHISYVAVWSKKGRVMYFETYA
jgi:hypothetical protein